MRLRAFVLTFVAVVGLFPVAFVLGAPIVAGAPQVSGEAAVPRISAADLKKAVDAGTVLVLDVRDADSYAAGHIPGAVLVPLDALSAKAPELKESKKPIVAYCA
ncbi:MAG: rhodanese-like domain-containing protein [Acidobacteria bacterium]|nr:rhodanese-like domain-containing protein [Acidobacteriota bacterium]